MNYLTHKHTEKPSKGWDLHLLLPGTLAHRARWWVYYDLRVVPGGDRASLHPGRARAGSVQTVRSSTSTEATYSRGVKHLRVFVARDCATREWESSFEKEPRRRRRALRLGRRDEDTSQERSSVNESENTQLERKSTSTREEHFTPREAISDRERLPQNSWRHNTPKLVELRRILRLQPGPYGVSSTAHRNLLFYGGQHISGPAGIDDVKL